MQKYSYVTSWAIVALYVSQIIIAISLGYIIINSSISEVTVTITILLQLFVATRFRGINNIIHECSHSTFSEVRDENQTIGKVCAVLTMNCFKDYRDEHLTHHMHLGDYEKDRDFQGIKELRLDEPLTFSVILRHLITPFVGRHLPYYIKLDLSERDGRMYQYSKIGLLFLVIAFSAAVPLAGVLFILIPYLFFFSALNYWADCLDHAGLVASDNELEASRNIAAARWFRVLFFPRNDSFHLVHHLFPQVPARYLEAVHETLKSDPEYNKLSNAVPRHGAMFDRHIRTWRSWVGQFN